jgi:4-cresol dehydrogenase (hydroxylating) flavoprotein subunit
MSATARFELTDEAVGRLEAALGAHAVLTSPEDLAEFRDPFWIPGDDTYVASAVVMPASSEEVQAVVGIADELGIPLWTTSQGRNNAYGGASPRLAGSVTISLRRMNRVLEIDGDLAYAVVEPGVSWFDLYDAIEAGGHDLMLSIPDLGWGSVVGNSLDNGETYLPYGMDFMAPCGLEVVLANGEILRTGMGAVPDSKVWHLYKRGLGPVLDPLFMQSNYGIVTRMGVWLMRKPEAYAPMLLTAPLDSDLEAVVDTLRELRLEGTLQGVPILFNTLIAASMAAGGAAFQADAGPTSDEEIQAMADAMGVGRWAVRCALWGPSAVVAARLERIRAAWARIAGGAVLHARTYGPDEYGEIEAPGDKVQAGIPNLDIIENFGDIGHVGFSPAVPLTGGAVREAVDLLRELIEREANADFLAGIIITNERSCVIVTGASFHTSDAEHVRRVYDAMKVLVTEAGSRGMGEYRAHLDFMDLAQEQYSFGDHAYRRFCETIKDAVDPKGILSPGRHGIWPSRLRA